MRAADYGDDEMSLIRTFAVGGPLSRGEMSKADRMDRVRVAILKEGRREEVFEGRTFEAMFEHAYDSKLDRRRFPRDEKVVPEHLPVEAEEVEDDEDTDADAELRLFR